jgi:hypothetical protein
MGAGCDPKQVRWVETNGDGSQHETYRVLSIGVDTGTLVHYFD